MSPSNMSSKNKIASFMTGVKTAIARVNTMYGTVTALVINRKANPVHQLMHREQLNGFTYLGSVNFPCVRKLLTSDATVG